MEETYLICEDSLEGILTGIYDAYARKGAHELQHLQIGTEDNLRLFASYVEIKADSFKAAKVANTINKEFGQDVFMDFCYALSSQDEDKGEAVYKTVVGGLTHKRGRHIMENLADPYVHKVFALKRSAALETHHLTGFLRFQELENGILSAAIGPKNNVITFLAPHFADRFPLENFVIYDDKREIFVVHPASKPWYVMRDVERDEEKFGKISDEEVEYQQLFTYFCKKIAIEGRKNEKLQKNNMPLRFQEYMVEFGYK